MSIDDSGLCVCVCDDDVRGCSTPLRAPLVSKRTVAGSQVSSDGQYLAHNVSALASYTKGSHLAISHARGSLNEL